MIQAEAAFVSDKVLKQKAKREAERIEKIAKDLKKSQDIRLLRNKEPNLPEVVKLFHHLP
jgi:hypothetical protein